jgi:hypothetical protein
MSSLDTEKKRGRKKKQVEEEVVAEKKKRGRKKKWESLSSVKIVMPESDEECETSNKVQTESNYDKESISFGDLNITVQTKDTTTDVIKNTLSKNIHTNQKSSICKIQLNSSDIEDSDDEQPRVNNAVRSKSTNGTTKILKVYENIYDKGKQVEKSDVYCYNCCHPFYCRPCFLPTAYEPQLKRYKLYGNFCSPNCTKRYALDNKHFNNCTHILSQMYREMYSYSYIIKPAPPKFLLKIFGGPLSINEYRDKFNSSITYTKKPVNCKMHFLEINEH